jgi:hypothetical protein
MTLSSLVSEGLVSVEKRAPISSSAQPHIPPANVDKIPANKENIVDRPGGNVDREDEDAAAVEMVTLEPAVYFVDLTEQDNDNIHIEEDYAPSQPSSSSSASAATKKRNTTGPLIEW